MSRPPGPPGPPGKGPKNKGNGYGNEKPAKQPNLNGNKEYLPPNEPAPVSTPGPKYLPPGRR